MSAKWDQVGIWRWTKWAVAGGLGRRPNVFGKGKTGTVTRWPQSELMRAKGSGGALRGNSAKGDRKKLLVGRAQGCHMKIRKEWGDNVGVEQGILTMIYRQHK